MHLNRSWPAVSHLGGSAGGEGGSQGGCGEGAGAYSQLEAEGHPQHLEPLHLEIHPDRRLIVLVKGVLAKPGGGVGVGGCQQPPGPAPPGDSMPPTPGVPSARTKLVSGSAQRATAPGGMGVGVGSGSLPLPTPPRAEPLWVGVGVPLPVDQAGLPHREVPHHDDLGDLEPGGAGGHTAAQWGWGGSLPASPRPGQPPGAERFMGWGMSPHSPPPYPRSPGPPASPPATAQPRPPCPPRAAFQRHDAGTWAAAAATRRPRPGPPTGAGGTAGSPSPCPTAQPWAWGPPSRRGLTPRCPSAAPGRRW